MKNPHKPIFDIATVKRLTKKDSKNPIERKVIKINEELGEFNQAILGYIQASNASGSVSRLEGDEKRALVLEEGCDVLNSTLNVLFSEGFSDDEIRNMFNKKLTKWESKL